MSRVYWIAASVTLTAITACQGPPTTAVFAVPGVSGTAAPTGAAPPEFYDLPFPNDLRRHPDGRLDLSLFPANSLLVDQIRAAAETLDGFGLNAGIYARFDDGLDPSSLPDPEGSIAADASVYLVNVDPASPERGARTPIIVRFGATAYQTLGANHLVARPYPGFPLDEGTTYALVITDRVRGANGDPVLVPLEITTLIDPAPAPADDPAYARARAVYQPLLAWLDEPGEDERTDLVSAAVFTTQHATFVGAAIRDGVYATPAPIAAGVTSTEFNTFTLFTGSYDAPNFQAGEVPYKQAPAGEIAIDANGVAIVQRTETMRFALTVPPGEPPAGGWPITIYSHGTGGNYISFVADRTAALLANEGIAVISTDQVLHETRNPGGNPELDFFNFGNAYAARDNPIQGFADAFSQLRLATGLSIPDPDGKRTHTFSATEVYYFGHSQGGITGPGFIAFEPSLRGAVLSGTAGLLYLNLLHKTAPLNIPDLVETFVRDVPLDADNPSLALLQMWIERSDSVNYAPLWVRKPPLGPDGARLAPRNIFQTEGFTDTYSPNVGIEAVATAIGTDLLQRPDLREVPGLALRGRSVLAAPITGNLAGVTAVLGQYTAPTGSDGHFVVFDIAAAREQAHKFLGTLARTGQATVVQAP